METFSLLLIALSVSVGLNIDAVQSRCSNDRSKNKKLGIEENIFIALESFHQPYHLICKSHTVEALDLFYLEGLTKIEKSVK